MKGEAATLIFAVNRRPYRDNFRKKVPRLPVKQNEAAEPGETIEERFRRHARLADARPASLLIRAAGDESGSVLHQAR